MKKNPVHNINAIAKMFIDNQNPLVQTAYLSSLAGSEELTVNIDSIEPGGISCKYHSHSLNEEFFLVLHGSGKVRLDNHFFDIKQGDFFAKPAGKQISHQFINSSADTLRVLDISLEKKGDIVEYPDEGVFLISDRKQAFEKKQVLKTWTSLPETKDSD